MKKQSNDKKSKAGNSIAAREESYRLAKLLRSGDRELARQLNTKRFRRVR